MEDEGGKVVSLWSILTSKSVSPWKYSWTISTSPGSVKPFNLHLSFSPSLFLCFYLSRSLSSKIKTSRFFFSENRQASRRVTDIISRMISWRQECKHIALTYFPLLAFDLGIREKIREKMMEERMKDARKRIDNREYIRENQSVSEVVEISRNKWTWFDATFDTVQVTRAENKVIQRQGLERKGV